MAPRMVSSIPAGAPQSVETLFDPCLFLLFAFFMFAFINSIRITFQSIPRISLSHSYRQAVQNPRFYPVTDSIKQFPVNSSTVRILRWLPRTILKPDFFDHWMRQGHCQTMLHSCCGHRINTLGPQLPERKVLLPPFWIVLRPPGRR